MNLIDAVAKVNACSLVDKHYNETALKMFNLNSPKLGNIVDRIAQGKVR